MHQKTWIIASFSNHHFPCICFCFSCSKSLLERSFWCQSFPSWQESQKKWRRTSEQWKYVNSLAYLRLVCLRRMTISWCLLIEYDIFILKDSMFFIFLKKQLPITDIKCFYKSGKNLVLCVQKHQLDAFLTQW